MQQIRFSCTIGNQSSFNDIGIEVWLDDKKFFDNNIAPGLHRICYAIDDTENDHILKFVMKNKTHYHTIFSESGDIIDDVLISITDLSFDDMKIDEIFYKINEYSHDFNGSGNAVVENFSGLMGCNGTVSLKFSTPFFLWLLEHM